MKRILLGLICGVIFLSLLTACSDNAKNTPNEKAVLMHDFVVRAPKKTTEMTATFLNSTAVFTESLSKYSRELKRLALTN